MLLVDAGNTRVKWRYEIGDDCVHGSCETHRVERELAGRLRESLPRLSIGGFSGSPSKPWKAAGEALLSSVLGKGKTALIVAQLESLGFSRVRVPTVLRDCAGVHAGYEDLSQLGVDRWLGLLAVKSVVSPAKNAVLVSAGSAITVDFMRASGEHLGGLIVPGLRLMRQQLNAGTAQAHSDEDVSRAEALTSTQTWALGASTVACVDNGLQALAEGLVHQISQKAEELFEGAWVVVLTGGDSLFFRGRVAGVERSVGGELCLDGPVFSGLKLWKGSQ